MCVCVCGVRGKEVGVQEEMPTGQSSETVVESEEELTVAGSLGIRGPLPPPHEEPEEPGWNAQVFLTSGTVQGHTADQRCHEGGNVSSPCKV